MVGDPKDLQNLSEAEAKEFLVYCMLYASFVADISALVIAVDSDTDLAMATRARVEELGRRLQKEWALLDRKPLHAVKDEGEGA